MNSNTYWQKREAEALKHYVTNEAEYEKRVQRIYTNMLANCQKEINAFYGNYASKEGISLAEAKKRVSSLDIKAYEAKAERYVKDREFSKQANEEMRLYNATMRINRLEMLKANIGLELIAGHDDLEKFMQGILQGRTEEELARQAGILGKTIKDNAKTVGSIVNASFHNATFSDRIWTHQVLLKNELAGLLQSGLIAGKNPRELARSVKKTFDTTTRNAERLMRTELARVQTDAQKQSFLRNGFTQYKFIVNGNCCDLCAPLAGKVFDVEKMMPGDNAPPMHPNCRCSTAAYEDSKEYEAWLDYLEKGGTTAEWGKVQAKTISSPIKARNTALGKPSAITQYDVELNKRQQAILDELPEYDSSVTVSKKSASMIDLAALTAKTGDEFAMFTKGNERLIIRGNSHSVNVNIDKAKELVQNGYRWSGHTHPGYDFNCLLASDDDYAILKAFGQKRCVTYNSLGQYLTYELE